MNNDVLGTPTHSSVTMALVRISPVQSSTNKNTKTTVAASGTVRVCACVCLLCARVYVSQIDAIVRISNKYSIKCRRGPVPIPGHSHRPASPLFLMDPAARKNRRTMQVHPFPRARTRWQSSESVMCTRSSSSSSSSPASASIPPIEPFSAFGVTASHRTPQNPFTRKLCGGMVDADADAANESQCRRPRARTHTHTHITSRPSTNSGPRRSAGRAGRRGVNCHPANADSPRFACARIQSRTGRSRTNR